MRALQVLLAAVILASVLAAAFGGGGYLLVRNAPRVIEGWRSTHWPSASGRIVRSEAVAKPVVASGRRGVVGTHVVALRYGFAVDGRSHAGSRRSLDDEGIVKSVEQAQREADALPPGSEVRVFYDPEDPSRSLLRPGVPAAAVVGLVLGLVLVAGGAALVALGLHLRAHHARRRARPTGARRH